jgi:hypothetical protein
LADAIVNRDSVGLKDARLQVSVVAAYLFGALLAGALVVHQLKVVAVLPLLAVGSALAIHALTRRSN